MSRAELLTMQNPHERVRAHPLYGTLRGVIEHRQFARINRGKRCILDAFTASAAWQIVCKLSEPNALMYLNMLDTNPAKFARVTWALVK